MPLRIAIVADIHHGAPSLTKRSDAALALMSEFATFVKAEQPDLVLDLGDRISDVDHKTDLKLEQEVADVFASINTPVHHVCGNHDRDHLSVADNENLLGQKLANEVLQLGDWNVALWRADTKITRSPEQHGFHLPETDLLWLAQMVQAAERPTLVVSHVPVSGHSQIGNYYFQRNPGSATYPEAERARAALAQARHPMVCLAGHVHWNTATCVDGIWHLTQQSLSESFTTQGAPARAWGMLELADSVQWKVFGADPFAATLTPNAGRWTPPMDPFQ